MATLCTQLLKNAWRLIVGSYLDSSDTHFINARLGRIIGDVLTAADKESALAYPSANQWLVDAIALWLTLGRLPRVTHDTFLGQDVVQSAEFIGLRTGEPHAILVHYFTRHERLFSAWSWKQQRDRKK
jgi:hypothetical protein